MSLRNKLSIVRWLGTPIKRKVWRRRDSARRLRLRPTGHSIRRGPSPRETFRLILDSAGRHLIVIRMRGLQ